MDSCPMVTKCPMFPVFRSETALKVMQSLYCHADFDRCARYQSVQTGVIPPRDLLPDGRRMGAIESERPKKKRTIR